MNDLVNCWVTLRARKKSFALGEVSVYGATSNYINDELQGCLESDVILPEGGDVRGTVYGSDGPPLFRELWSWAQIEAHPIVETHPNPSRPFDRWSFHATVDSNGNYKLDGLPVGTFNLRLITLEGSEELGPLEIVAGEEIDPFIQNRRPARINIRFLFNSAARKIILKITRSRFADPMVNIINPTFAPRMINTIAYLHIFRRALASWKQEEMSINRKRSITSNPTDNSSS